VTIELTSTGSDLTREASPRRRVHQIARSWAKRGLDLILAAALLAVLSPVLLLLALAIRLDSPGPSLFLQRRTGLNGQIFTIWKFRTMACAGGGLGGWTARGDSRITLLGRTLRRFSVDELPQLVNVIRGDMALVGPRPHPVDLDEAYQGHVDGYTRRFLTRPGLTGLAQVRDHRGTVDSLEEMTSRVAADLDYIERWSIWLDLAILARTVPHVLRTRNAY
jgi:putative colanic acid biosynthesis UDP-glucose lipid carrier transferase